jgi:hypothetical protein
VNVFYGKSVIFALRVVFVTRSEVELPLAAAASQKKELSLRKSRQDLVKIAAIATSSTTKHLIVLTFFVG